MALPTNLTKLSIAELIAQLRMRGSTVVRGKKADLVKELQVGQFCLGGFQTAACAKFAKDGRCNAEQIPSTWEAICMQD